MIDLKRFPVGGITVERITVERHEPDSPPTRLGNLHIVDCRLGIG